MVAIVLLAAGVALLWFALPHEPVADGSVQSVESASD
jgi:hypothetical protein